PVLDFKRANSSFARVIPASEKSLPLSSTTSWPGFVTTSALLAPGSAGPPRTASTPKYRRYAVILETPGESQSSSRFIPLFDTGVWFFNENPYAQSAIMFRDFRRRVWSPNLSRPSWVSIVHPLPGGPNAANACDDNPGRPTQGQGSHRRGGAGAARRGRHEEGRAQQQPDLREGGAPGR